jgi:hypothetical protein
VDNSSAEHIGPVSQTGRMEGAHEVRSCCATRKLAFILLEYQCELMPRLIPSSCEICKVVVHTYCPM